MVENILTIGTTKYNETCVNCLQEGSKYNKTLLAIYISS
jgi:hypothetical protein